MKNLKEYLQINEVSRALAKNAFDKATGAQKNRIKKLYKEIYNDDLEKSDISHINFTFLGDAEGGEIFGEDEIKEAFSHWSQEVIDKIDNITIDYWYSREPGIISHGGFEIRIDGKSYEMEVEYEGDEITILETSLKNKDTDTADIFFYIAELYKEKYK